MLKTRGLGKGEHLQPSWQGYMLTWRVPVLGAEGAAKRGWKSQRGKTVCGG